jgi:bacteriocin-like protein
MAATSELSAAELAQIEGGITFVYGSLLVNEFVIKKATDSASP